MVWTAQWVQWVQLVHQVFAAADDEMESKFQRLWLVYIFFDVKKFKFVNYCFSIALYWRVQSSARISIISIIENIS